MYKSHFYCSSCRHMRWPGDCEHGTLAVAQLNPGSRMLLRQDRCPCCHAMPNGCRCHQTAALKRAADRRVVAAGLAGAWRPDFPSVSVCCSFSQYSGESVIVRIDDQQHWLATEWFAFCSPRFMIEETEWCAQRRSSLLLQTTVFQLQQFANTVHEKALLGKKRRNRNPEDRAFGDIQQVSSGPRTAFYSTAALWLFRGQVFAGLREGSGAVLLVVRNHFGGLIGLVADYRHPRAADESEWIEVG